MLYVYFCAWHAKTAARDGDSLSLHEAQRRASTDAAAAAGGGCLLRSCCSDPAAGEDFTGADVAGAWLIRRVV
jgi:hypothetical protein